MWGPRFLLQISGSGLVAPSGMFFNAKFSKLHIGNYTEQRFKDIFNSSRYDEVMNYIVGDKFDARYMMGSLPIQHYLNVALWRDRHTTEKIQKLIQDKHYTSQLSASGFKTYSANLSSQLSKVSEEDSTNLNLILNLWDTKELFFLWKR